MPGGPAQERLTPQIGELSRLSATALIEGYRKGSFTPSDVVEAVRRCAGRIEVEVTGGMTLDTVAGYAAARPDFISVGALTHSAGVVDLGFDLRQGT